MFPVIDNRVRLAYDKDVSKYLHSRWVEDMANNRSTSDKLLQAAVDLMAEKGYDGTSTKEIAQAAGVNEVTLFRHFGTKGNLLEAALQHNHYADEMTKLFHDDLVGDLHADLLLISRTYHKIMNRNRKLIAIAQKGGSTLPEGIQVEADRHPQQLKKLLTEYLIKMSHEQKATITNPEIQALSFMWMHYGAFNSVLSSNVLESFIEESTRLFTKALTT